MLGFYFINIFDEIFYDPILDLLHYYCVIVVTREC